MKFISVKDASSLSERVSRQLEDAILTGKVRVSDRLPTEASLGESFGVSRTVVREAIKRLEAKGLVESHVGSGSYVAAYPIDQVRLAMGRFVALNSGGETFLHLLDLRRVVELETAERMARSRDAAALAAVRESLATMRAIGYDRGKFARADMEFHLAIARASANPFFASILEPLKDVGRAFGEATYEGRELMDRVMLEHQAIFDAIEAGDAGAARQRMLEHIEFSRSHYLQLLARHEPAAAPARPGRGA